MSPVRAGPRQRLRVQRVDLVPGGGRGSYPERAGVRTLAKQDVGESLLHVQTQSRGQKTKREASRAEEEKAGAWSSRTAQVAQMAR